MVLDIKKTGPESAHTIVIKNGTHNTNLDPREIAKEAEEKFISDTVAAQFLVFNHKEFEHLHYNTVRRYFKDYRYGLIR